MEYFLMRKDDVITLCDFMDNGQMISFAPNYRNPELAPLAYRTSKDGLLRWWNERQIPINQGRVKAMLEKRGLIDAGDYLLKNLGLSLSDYYWIKPVDSSLKWRDVNLFENDFKEDLLRDTDNYDSSSENELSPNSSLQGELEKTWIIDKSDGKRKLLKGNHGNRSTESINEVIASELHRLQGYDNYTEYKLLKIKGREYDFGCSSDLFTNQNLEFVSANAIITSKHRQDKLSKYEHLIKVSTEHGIDPDAFRRDLEYQILTDYILTNTDRHMDNIGILRDADTLKFIRMAPIYDTGRAFACREVTPYTDDEISNVAVNSFEKYEKDLLKLVTDRTLVDTSRLPTEDYIAGMLGKDSKLPSSTLNAMVRLYGIKIQQTC